MTLSAKGKALLFFVPVAVAVAIALWWLYPTEDYRQRGVPVFGNAQLAADRAWLQPAAINDLYPQAISPDRWPVDFEAIEVLFARFPVNTAGELALDATMATALEQARLQLPNVASADLLDRVSALLRKSFPGHKGEQLAALFRNYSHYEQAKQKAVAAASQQHPPGSAEAAMAALQASMDLQEKYLGKTVAAKLYGKKNAMAGYLLARRQLRGDATLSESAKRERLRLLEQAYREGNLQ